MKNIATIKLKIPKKEPLLELFCSFLSACQYSADKAFESKCKHKYELHRLIYYKLREKFKLKAQFAVNAIARGFEAYRSCKKKVIFKKMPIRFDRRTFTFSPDKVSLTTAKKRCIVPLQIPEYYHKYLSWSYQTADMFLDRKGRLFLNITFKREVKASDSEGKVIGVDLGINNLAVCSDGTVFKTPKTKIMQFRYLRRKLQAKGTKPAKRKLKGLSGRQKRYMAWINHIVSKQIAGNAGTIVLEDLKGIRKNKHGKRFNRWLHGWSFFQLQGFIKYKAGREGKKVSFVNPYMTSQTCSCCGDIGSRYANSFVCLHCGIEIDADFNASCNLRRLYVNQPIVSGDEGKASTDELRQSLRDKPHILMWGS